MKRIKPKEQKPENRIKNFDEVCFGYTEEEAVNEAQRCLQCKKPMCVEGCPVRIGIPDFIKLIKEKKFSESAEKIMEKSALPAVCGRVCPQEQQCEFKCILGIKGEPVNIGKLERFASQYSKISSKAIKKNRKVAVVGSGPAGLTCAADLAMMGYKTTIFEALHKPGGVLIYGIPEFRLPKSVVEKEIEQIRQLGVEIRLNSIIGNLYTIEELAKDYDAVFIASGAGTPHFLGIPGETLNCVLSANEFLTRINLMKAYRFPEYATPVKRAKHIVVIGGGNVAIDSARCARRLGSEVTIIYRRTKEEMPARREEIHHAEEEGIKFQFLTSPIKIIGKNKVESIECIRMELGPEDESGRKSPVPISNSNFTIECDQVIVAIGQTPNPLIQKTAKDIKFGKKGTIDVSDNLKTSMKNVFAGGDIISGSATVIKAMADGKKAAKEIDSFLK